MDAARFKHLIYRGHAKAAKRIGFLYSLYRPTTYRDPINADNLVGTLNAAFTVHSAKEFSFDMPSDLDHPQFHALVDGEQVQVGDYLVGPNVGNTYFIASMTPGMPILAIWCNRVATLYKATAFQALGLQPYSPTITQPKEYSTSASMANWPVCILKAKALREQYLPQDVGTGSYNLIMPANPEQQGGLAQGTILIDDLGFRYGVMLSDEQAGVWRAEIQRVQT